MRAHIAIGIIIFVLLAALTAVAQQPAPAAPASTSAQPTPIPDLPAAQQLPQAPDAPSASKAKAPPNPLAERMPRPPVHRFWDRTNLGLFGGIAVTRGFDYASTRNMQRRGREEILLPDDVVNSTPGFAALEAAATGTSIGLSYLLHRTGHHRLERWLSIGHISVAGFGDARNYLLETKHPVVLVPLRRVPGAVR